MEWLTNGNEVMNSFLGLDTAPNFTPLPTKDTTLENNIVFVQDPSSVPSSVKLPKKIRFKEPIFVKGVSHSNNKNKNKSEVSSDSEEDTPSAEHLKSMTSKERRQFRNKISARNFRVRRKEYIGQLEQRLDEKENIINDLKRENERLLKANRELMEQMISQPPLMASPPSQPSMNEEHISSSSSEGQCSPEPFRFPLDNLYNFGLFDQPEQAFTSDTFSSLFINHAAVPDIDFHRVLSDKMGVEATEEGTEQEAANILKDHPLLGAALMSIVLRHTMSLECVVSAAKQISHEDIKEETPNEEVEDKKTDKKTKSNMRIENAPEKGSPITKVEIYEYIFNHCFGYYAFLRAKGRSHENIMARFAECFEGNSECAKKFLQTVRPDQVVPEHETKDTPYRKKLHAYCKVAATLLKNPKRMAHVGKIINQKLNYPHLSQDHKPALIKTENDLRISTS
ncbi:hypothetical protein BY458DRAFT_437265 [Sporodiniella umbellata]|nr:hypothetical protein BY458DRAFT_437265 [Sporodiniella umbellata]